QSCGEVAVIGQNQQTFGVEVESADRIHVLADISQEINHGRAALRIRARRDVSFRLVPQEIPMPFWPRDPSSVHSDVVARGIRLRAELANRRAIYRDATFEHQLLGRAS